MKDFLLKRIYGNKIVYDYVYGYFKLNPLKLGEARKTQDVPNLNEEVRKKVGVVCSISITSGSHTVC